jgi:putative ABC transport system permease protein
VVADFGAAFHGEPPGPALYLPLDQHPGFSQTLLVRSTAGAVPNLPSTIRAAVTSVDPGVPVEGLRTAEGTVEDWLRESRAIGKALGFTALLALGMAVLGLYGMVAHSMAQRTFELGVRMVLGAGRVQVRLSVMRAFLAYAGLGLLLGVAISLAVGRVARSFLVLLQVSYIPMTLGITGLLASVVILATYLPARRATLIAPSVALRTE